MKKLFTILALALTTLSFSYGQTSLSQGGTGWSTSTTGDLLVGTTSKLRYTRLPIGSAGYVLQSVSGQPAWVATSSLGISGGSGLTGSGSNGQVSFWNGASSLTGTSSFFWDDTIFDATRGRLLIGIGASTTTYPAAKMIVAPNTSSDAEAHNIGIVGTAVASSTASTVWGVGGYFKGWTNGATRSAGVVGEGMVTATGDSGSAIGVRGYSNQTHAGGMNIGLLGEATNGLNNYALYMSSGNIFSSSTQSWGLNSSVNALNFDSNTLSIDALNNRIGIGTSTPGSVLDILTDAGSANGIRLTSNTGLVRGYWTQNQFAMKNSADDTFGIVLNSDGNNSYIKNGNVGIGTVSPLSLLNVQGTNTGGVLTLSNSSTTVLAGDSMGKIDFYTNDVSTISDKVVASIKSIAEDTYFGIDNAPTSLAFITHGTGASSTEKMRITGSGNVGIGTTTPGNLLTVALGNGIANTIPALGVNGGSFGLFANGGKYGLISGVLGTGNVYMQSQRIDGTATAYNMSLQPSGGNVGIGTSTPNTKLYVNGTTTTQGLTVGRAYIAGDETVDILGNFAVESAASTDAFSVIAGRTIISQGLGDSTNATGTAGQVLTSTGTSTLWVATSSLGITSTPFSSSSAMTIGTLYSTSTSNFIGTSNTFTVSSTSVATIGTLYATSSVTLATTTANGDITMNARIIKRVVGYASAASTTINMGTTDIATTTINQVTTFVNPTGTSTAWDGQPFMLRALATTTQNIFWGNFFQISSTTGALPSTVASGTTLFIFEFNKYTNKLMYEALNSAFN